MKALLKSLFFILLFVQICFAQWVQTNFPSNTNVFCLAARESYLYAGTSNEGIYLSTDNGDSWNSVSSSLFCDLRAITFSGQNIIAASSGGRCGEIDLSTDNGISWSEVFGGRTLSLVSSDNKVFAGTGGVWFSSDYGMTWESVNNGLQNSYIRALTVSGSNVFAGSDGNGVFLTTNNGISWTAVNNGLSNLFVNAFAVSNNNIFAGTSDGIFLTTDYGTNWSIANAGLPPGSYIADFAVIDTSIFASIGYNSGNSYSYTIYLSANFGESWSDVGSGLPLDIPNSELTIEGDFLFAAGQNVWRRPLSEMITDIEEITNKLPQNFTLHQNYPNPFNPSTKIQYSIPQSSFVQIKVFGVLGNEIENLVNEEKPIGTYEITWNAEQLPSGIYFYQLKAGNYIETKKMLLLK